MKKPRIGRPTSGEPQRQVVSCRLHPASIAEYKRRGGESLSTELARLFETRYSVPDDRKKGA